MSLYTTEKGSHCEDVRFQTKMVSREDLNAEKGDAEGSSDYMNNQSAIQVSTCFIFYWNVPSRFVGLVKLAK